MDEALPFISVILAVQNEERYLARTLSQLAEQEYPPDRFEVLVVDGFSTDRTVTIAESFSRTFTHLQILHNPLRLAGSSRNLGFRQSRGEFCLVIDGHVFIPSRRLLRDMVELFASTGKDVLSRSQPLTPPDNLFFQNAVAFARESFLGHGSDSTIYDPNYEGEVDPSSSAAMYRKTVFDRVGYIDESFDAAEDYEFNYRLSKAGYRSYISPKLTVFYYPRQSLAALFRQMVRYGLGRLRFVRKHPEQIISGNLIPPLFFVMLILTGVMAIFIRQLAPIPICLAGIYLLALIAGSIAVALRRGLAYLPVLPLVFLTIHLGLAWGFLNGFRYAKGRGNSRDVIHTIL